jgi:hypothetical protein
MSSNPVTLRRFVTVKQLAQTEPSFSEAALRNLIFNATPRHTSRGPIPGNGLGPHIRRVGTKLLIDHLGFLSWIDAQGNHVESLVRPQNLHESCRALPAATINNSATEFPAASSDPSASGKQEVRPKLRGKEHSRRRT